VAPGGRLHDGIVAAVGAAGAEVVEPEDAAALLWDDPTAPHLLPEVLARGPQVGWVQLPYAGVEPYLEYFDRERIWTCGKEVYAEPVAEQVVMLGLAGLRGLATFARARTWSPPEGRNLLGGSVLVLGGGGITRSLLRLLGPFGCRVTVLRRSAEPLEGATVIGPGGLHGALPHADLVVLALSLTPETEGIIGAAELELMAAHAWLVNVARGGHVDHDALVEALRAGSIGGAALDVTDPEPLPDGHPLWSLPNCLITPHVGNTPAMGAALIIPHYAENVRRYLAGEDLLGRVDIDRGY
jgi:phosphoglycerate dehydrogenase-like enzyme